MTDEKNKLNNGSTEENTMFLDTSDIIRLILQFLSENRLTKSLSTLQVESGVALNSVPSVETLASAVINGEWFTVMSSLNDLALPIDTALAVYEEILMDLHNSGDSALCEAILNDPAVAELRLQSPAVFDAMVRSYPSRSRGRSNTVVKQAREILEQKLRNCICEMNGSMLVQLLGAGYIHSSLATQPEVSSLLEKKELNIKPDEDVMDLIQDVDDILGEN